VTRNSVKRAAKKYCVDDELLNTFLGYLNIESRHGTNVSIINKLLKHTSPLQVVSR
jgi:hypothetical protein